MPTRALRICRRPGCNKTTPNKYCDVHQGQDDRDRSRQRRESGPKPLYDRAAWRAVRHGTRAFILSRDPLCQIGVICFGRALSTVVDHIIRAEIYIAQNGGDESMFYDPANLRGACDACHNHKTRLENLGQWKETGPPDPDGG